MLDQVGNRRDRLGSKLKKMCVKFLEHDTLPPVSSKMSWSATSSRHGPARFDRSPDASATTMSCTYYCYAVRFDVDCWANQQESESRMP